MKKIEQCIIDGCVNQWVSAEISLAYLKHYEMYVQPDSSISFLGTYPMGIFTYE